MKMNNILKTTALLLGSSVLLSGCIKETFPESGYATSDQTAESPFAKEGLIPAMPTVLITHYMNEAAEADRCVVMNDGRVVLDGTPREVFREVELLEKMGLEVPQATKLAHELRKRGIELGDVINVEECVAALREQLER